MICAWSVNKEREADRPTTQVNMFRMDLDHTSQPEGDPCWWKKNCETFISGQEKEEEAGVCHLIIRSSFHHPLPVRALSPGPSVVFKDYGTKPIHRRFVRKL